MDMPTPSQLSQIFGMAALGLKVGVHFYQKRFPDAKNVRKFQVPAFGLGALSFISMSNIIGGFQYGIATLRSSLRNTKFGTKHKGLVTTFSMATMGAVSAMNFKSVEDILPLIAITIGSLGDYTSQGRYQRFLYSTAVGSAVVPFNTLKHNWALAAAEAFSLVFSSMAAFKHDVKNAAGPNANLKQNLKAYLYGIFKNSATGASMEAQLPIEPGHKLTKEELKTEWERFAETHPNPHFTPQAV